MQDEELTDIMKRIQDLEDEFRRQRQDTNKNLQILSDNVLTRTSIDQLAELDSKLQEKLNDLF